MGATEQKKLTQRRGERSGARRGLRGAEGFGDVVEWRNAAASRRSVLRARRVWLRIDAPPEDASEQIELASKLGGMEDEDDRAVGV
jgi:hypothetical protein